MTLKTVPVLCRWSHRKRRQCNKHSPWSPCTHLVPVSRCLEGGTRSEYDHHLSRGSVGPLWNLHSNCRSMSPSEALSMDSPVICHWRQSIGPRASLTCPAGVHGLSISPDGEQLQLGKSLAHGDHPPEEPHPQMSRIRTHGGF